MCGSCNSERRVFSPIPTARGQWVSEKGLYASGHPQKRSMSISEDDAHKAGASVRPCKPESDLGQEMIMAFQKMYLDLFTKQCGTC